ALRREAMAHGLNVPILAKIERPEAVENAEKIIQAFDAIMVARGDLGVEIPLEHVPTVQKRLIATARIFGRPVITATDMLDSMRENPRPTRAEASDVANAIYDGTDAVMLSGETAVGKYPVEAVACMDRIATAVELQFAVEQRTGESRFRLPPLVGSIDDHITHATCELAHEVGADAIITPTSSGRTARLIARHRPAASIIAPAPSEAVVRQMALIWGVRSVPLEASLPSGADRLAAAVRAAFAAGAVRAGQLAVVLAGHPAEGGDRWPTIRLVRVGAAGTSHEP
ncbi:MAG: pyruvate kinase, partial [Gemmataceae bacterium]